MSARSSNTPNFRAPLFTALALTSLLAACSGDEPSKTPPPGTPASATAKPTGMTTESAMPAAQGAMPAGHPKTDGKALVFKMPEGWVAETPTVSMRREQYSLAKQGTDTDDVVVTVSVLSPGDGGDKASNLKRWAEQFSQPDGKPSMDVMKQSTHKLNGAEVTDIDVSGTYVASMPGMQAASPVNKPGWRMLLSWVQSPLGNYYIKIYGPEASVAHWEPSFHKFVDSGVVQ